ncbi:MAG: hypothetical protein AB7V62_16540 [Thermoleophilia bacterium]
MTYYLPPPEDEGRARGVPGIAPVGAPHGAAGWAGPGEGPAPPERLVRVTRMPAAEAAGHLARWVGERPGVRPLAAPEGVVARERSRADRDRPGGTRRQRLALRVAGGEAVALHWSAPEPVGQADEDAWTRALDRLTAGTVPATGAGRGGWTA